MLLEPLAQEPGENPPSAIRHLFILLGGCAAVWWWTYGLWDLWGPDEARYVQVGKELLRRANWFYLTVHGEPYDQKPPLPFWMFARLVELCGGAVSAWAVRLPSVILGTLTVLMTYDIGRRRFGERAGFLAGLIVLTSPVVIRQTPTARLDMLFAGWITAALWAWLARPSLDKLSPIRAALFWLFLACAFFTKGPLALLIVLATVLGESWRSRSWSAWRSLRPAAGLPILIALIAGWLWAQKSAAGAAFVEEQVSEQTVGRILGGGHQNAVWYYAEVMPSILGPWLAFLIAGLVWAWKGRKGAPASSFAPLFFWVVPTLVLLHIASGKRHQYLLPFVPAMALFIGAYLDRDFLGRSLPRWTGLAMLVLTGLVGIGGLGFVVYATFWPRAMADAVVHFTRPELALIGGASGALWGVVFLARRLRPAEILVVCPAMGMIVFAIGLLAAVQPAMNERNSTLALSRTLQAMAGPGGIVGGLDDGADPKYHVYGSYRVKPFKINKSETAEEADLAPIILAEAKDAKKKGEWLKKAGYIPAQEFTVDGDPMVIFSRPKEGRPVAESPLYFGVAGDTGTGDKHAYQIARQMAEVDAKHPFSAVLLLGDNIYGEEPYPIALEKRFLHPFAPLLERGVPFHAALGNHDYDHDRLEGELHTALLNMDGREYRSVKFGETVEFFILSSETLRKDPRQVAWFEEASVQSRAKWKIVVLHDPLASSDASHGPDREGLAVLRKVLEGPADIDMVLAGHNHFYERRKIAGGIQHITLGSGGELARSITLPPDEGRAAGYNQSRCFGWMEIEADRLRFHVVDQRGAAIDEFTLRDPEEPGRLEIIESATGLPAIGH